MKKLGFTLIELLAVILILGIIALIAIPTINNIIKESKRGAFKTSVQNIVKGIEERCRIEQMKGEMLTSSYTFDENGATPNLDIKGSLPTSGAINVDEECNVTVLGVTDDNYVVSKPQDSDDITIKDKEESDIKLVEAIMRDNKVGSDLVLPIVSPSLATDKLFLKSQDDDGTTYYFRGNVDNNYVEFGSYRSSIYTNETNHDGFDWISSYQSLAACEHYSDSECVKSTSSSDKMIWRIVRINGDGTVRLVLSNSVASIPYSEYTNEEKYKGYTYDRENSSIGTDSFLKSMADSWYDYNIGSFENFDNLVATSKFCSDTSNKEAFLDGYIYGFVHRLSINNNEMASINPTFKCAVSNEAYGGEYNLKVGILNADEYIYAGLYYYNGADFNSNFYLWNGSTSWTMSPAGTYDGMFIYGSDVVMSAFDINETLLGLRPVINLKADALITNGNGTASNPYVINVE